MKNFKEDWTDTLRPEYKRSDFGEFTIGKYANIPVDFAEMARLLLVCLGEDEGLHFHNAANLTVPKPGDWTYSFDVPNQMRLSYWIDTHTRIDETVTGPLKVSSPKESANLRDLIHDRFNVIKESIRFVESNDSRLR